MQTGAITSYIDVAQVTLYVFWIFFAGLLLYLRREDKREGYPLETDLPARIVAQGFPAIPASKTFALAHGGTVSAPSGKVDARAVHAQPIGNWPGAPLEPTNDPMIDGVGPAAYAERAEEPELTIDGQPAIVPLRTVPDFAIESRDPDPRGMKVVAGDGKVAGIVRDVWVDRTEPQIRYLELEVVDRTTQRRVLLPIYFARIDGSRRQIKVQSIMGRHFASVPGLKNPDRVTKREEDRITAYFAGGTLYAEPSRLGPVL
ncbi:MAG: photosynthetic reaction center subunit H [Alphaproteobacteria bacterium]|nr:photosynthetic reaction center subunit H [Alphaproteobacteria bacterium]